MQISRNVTTPSVLKKQSIYLADNTQTQLTANHSSAYLGIQSSHNNIQNGQLSNQQSTQMPSVSYLTQLVQSNTPLTSALSAAVYSQSKLIYSKNGAEALEIASLTKVMTFFTSLKLSAKHELDPQRVYVRVPKFAAFICGTSACLRNGEYIKLCDLFYALMLPSGNDAACTLANFFGQLERRKPNSAPWFLDEQSTINLLDLYGLCSAEASSGKSKQHRESDISTDTPVNDSKDSGEEEIIRQGGEKNFGQGVTTKRTKEVQQIQQQQEQKNNQQLVQLFEQQKVLDNKDQKQSLNQPETIKFHSHEGDVQDNMKVFVKLMNQEAQRLQMRTTQYTNPHGLSDKGNKSSAIDYGKLCYTAMTSFALFREVVKTSKYTCKVLLNKELLINKKSSNSQYPTKTESSPKAAPPKQTQRNAFWENTNRLLTRNHNFIGIKTGNTPNAGPCLATHYSKNGIDIQVIVLKCKDSEKRWVDSQKLAEWAYQQIQQEINQTLQFDGLSGMGNGRLMSAQRNRKIKFQQFQDEFTKLLQQNKEEDPSSKSQLMADFNSKYRPKSTIQYDHPTYKASSIFNGSAAPSLLSNNSNSNNNNNNNYQQQSNSSQNKLKTEKSRNLSTHLNREEPQSTLPSKQSKTSRQNNFNTMIIGDHQKSIINSSQNNIRANQSQILTQDEEGYELASNSSIEIISCEEFELKNQQLDIGIDENNLSFEKNQGNKVGGDDMQILSESFEVKMEELLTLKCQSQKTILVNKNSCNNLLSEANTKKFSSQNNLDQPEAINSYRQIPFKKNPLSNDQQSISKKPMTAAITPSHANNQIRSIAKALEEVSVNKLVSPRRKVFYAKSSMGGVIDLKQSAMNGQQPSDKLASRGMNYLSNRVKSGRVFNLNLIQGDKKQNAPVQNQAQQPLLFKNYSSKNNSTKNIVFEKRLPPIINKSISITSNLFSEDITSSPPKQNSKNFNVSVIKSIFQ